LEHSLAPLFRLGERDWRKLTIILGAVAAVEAIALLVVAVVLIVPSMSHQLKSAAERDATVPEGATGPHTPAGRAKLSPASTPVMVLNGNGQSGAAAAGATNVRRLGYKLSMIGNAQRMDYPVSLVMYRPGLRPEALKFAKKMHVRTVGPLDGIKLRKLGRAKLVYIVGAS
jgi:LytR cell envelope-related transcriptional attenuator